MALAIDPSMKRAVRRRIDRIQFVKNRSLVGCDREVYLNLQPKHSQVKRSVTFHPQVHTAQRKATN
ncbi:hypothetical protein HDF12_000322 [Edaphobacter lichenicola]|uniref:Uncharacterized protein n=1 Tax=Tunturiibacter lichenicola TaxID=2051959 RepID=A0A7Y9NIQ3_9BACT|nr:hypothetical protein [Edaphobacter lichenicola]